MLVLSRKLNESIVINDNVVVTVLGVQGRHGYDSASTPRWKSPFIARNVREDAKRGGSDECRVGRPDHCRETETWGY